MGLNAKVFCDCFERDRLRSIPPPGCRLSLAEDGGLLCGSDDPNAQIAFDRWRFFEACKHKCGCLVDHRIGNIDKVAALRRKLSCWPERFPIILACVIHDGTHCGDFIPVTRLRSLALEVDGLSEIDPSDPDRESFMGLFESQMRDLTGAALQVGKPIVF